MAKDDFDSLKETLFPDSYTIQNAAYNRTGDSVKLTLTGEETLVLPASDYALLKLREGSVISREELLELKKTEARHKARQKAVKLLERRAYTSAQLKLKLSEALVTREIIKEVIEYCQERGYLNDDKYAEGWIASQLKRKPQGRRMLYAGLLRKGVSKKESERLLAEGYSPEQEEEQCEAFMKKLAGQRGWDADDLLPSLARRGFDIGLIKRVYRKLKSER